MISSALFWLSLFLIFYTMLGYPAVIALLAQLKPARTVERIPQDSLPFLSIIIAAYNEEAVIGRKLDNTLSLHYPADKLQILVAADGSNDRTAAIVESYQDRGVELSFLPDRCGKLAAVNRAMRDRVRGEIVVFSDANNHFDENALLEMVKYFQDPKVGVVSGAKHIVQDSLLASSEGFYWKYESFLKKKEAQFNSCTGLVGEIMAVRKDLYVSPSDSIINDDFYIGMLIAAKGYRIAYAPEARSFETTSNDPAAEITRRSRMVAGRYQAMALAGKYLNIKRPIFAWQVISHKFARALIPLALLTVLLTNIWLTVFPIHAGGLLRLSPPWSGLILSLQVAFYGLALAAAHLKKFGPFGRVLYIPAFFINSNYAALLGLLKFLSGKQSVLWKKAERAPEESGQ